MLLSLVCARESSEGVETPNIGVVRCRVRRGVSSESCCEARNLLPNGEFLSPDIALVAIHSRIREQERHRVKITFIRGCAVMVAVVWAWG